MLTRRQFIRTGIAGAAVLGLARFAYGPFSADPAFPVSEPEQFKFLDIKSRTALAAIAAVMLEGALPQDKAAHADALQAVVMGADTVIAGLPDTVQAEMRDLLMLLNQPLARRWLVGVTAPWQNASRDDIVHFLNRWRFSSILLLRSGYQALHQILFAAWYGNPRSWVGIGYEGPPEFVKRLWKA